MSDWRNSPPPGGSRLPSGSPVLRPASKSSTARPDALSRYVSGAVVHESVSTSALSTRVRIGLFSILAMNLVYLAVMGSAPDTSDLFGIFTSFITWSGHQWAPIALAAAAVVGLTAVAFTTDGFTRVSSGDVVAIWGTGAASAFSTGLALLALTLYAVAMAVVMVVVMGIIWAAITGD